MCRNRRLFRLGSHPIKNRLCISNNLHRFCRNHHIYHPMDRNAGKKTGRWIWGPYEQPITLKINVGRLEWEHCKSAGVCHFYSCLAEKGSGNFLPETNTVPIRILLSTASMPDSFETSSGTSPHDLLHEPFLSVHLPVPSSPLYYSSTGHGDNPATQESMP